MEESPSATCVPADFNLRNWATIAYTATLWNKSNIAPFFDKANRIGNSTYIRKMVQEKEKELESANFPRKISDEILCLFKIMGQRIALWCEYATEVLRIDKEVIPTVAWTVYGTIDEAKILKNVTNLIDIENELVLPLKAVYYTACSNVSIDFIQIHWKEMLKFCEIYLREANFLGQSPAEPKLQFIASSVIFLAKVELSELFPSQVKYVESFECNKTEGMFWLSLREGCPKAVRYYWSLLSESQRMSFIPYAADYALREYWTGEKYDFFKEERPPKEKKTFAINRNKSFADILIFFYSLMPEDELSEYLWNIKTQNKHFIFKILEVLMYHWPLEEFLPLALQFTPTYCDDLSDCKKIINRIIDVIYINKDFGLDDKQIFHRKLFIDVWEKLRTFISWQEIFENERELLNTIYSTFDLGILKFLRDNCEEEDRPSFVIYCGPIYKILLETKQYKLLERFKEDVLQSENERRWFVDTCFSYLDFFFKECRFSVVDHLLDSIPGQRKRFNNDFRNKQYLITQCAWLISTNQIQLANDSLKWMFKIDLVKDYYASSYLNTKMDWVFTIWKTNEKKFAENLFRFLMWLLESQNTVNRFKNCLLISQQALMNLFAALFDLQKSADGYQRGSVIFKIFDEYLLFCTDSSPEKVKLLKRKICENYDDWILFLSKRCCLHCVDDFLNYVFENKEEKVKVTRVSKIHDEKLKAGRSAYWAKCNREVLKSWKDMKDISTQIVTDCRYIYFVRRIDGGESVYVDLIPSTKSLWVVTET